MTTLSPAAIIVLSWLLLNVVACGWAMTHALRAPAESWQMTGQNRHLWVALLLVALFTGIGVVGVLAYLIIQFPAARWPAKNPAAARVSDSGWDPAASVPQSVEDESSADVLMRDRSPGPEAPR